MFCKNCGKEMKDGTAFCSECGTKNDQGATEVNTQVDTTAFQSAMSNSSGTAVAVKKKSKGKFIIIGVFVLLIIIVIACAVGGDSETEVDNNTYFEDTVGDSEENVIKTLAIEAVREQVGISHDEDVFDVEIIDSDGKFNYIVSASTEDNHGFETWWYILLKLDTKTGKMQNYVHYHGEDDWDGEIDDDRFTRDNIPEYYRTNDKFGWGEKNHIE